MAGRGESQRVPSPAARVWSIRRPKDTARFQVGDGSAREGGTATPNLVARPASHSRPTRLCSHASMRSAILHARTCLHCSRWTRSFAFSRGASGATGRESIYGDLVPLAEDGERKGGTGAESCAGRGVGVDGVGLASGRARDLVQRLSVWRYDASNCGTAEASERRVSAGAQREGEGGRRRGQREAHLGRCRADRGRRGALSRRP